MRFIVFITATVIIFSCTGTQSPNLSDSLEPQLMVSIADADSYWEQRADTVLAQRALHTYQQLAEGDSTSVVIASKLSRAYYYHGQFLATTMAQKDSLFLLGHETCQAVLKKDTDYYNLLFSTGDEHMAVQGLDKVFLDALYWGMANYGQWLATKGDIVRLGQRDLIWTTLEHIHVLDSNYYHGAYYRYKGALLARDPETQHDTLAIRAAFETAIEIAPEYLGNYTLMAMFYCPLTKDKELFYQLLTTVITSSSDPALPYHPENIHEKALAENLMIRAEKEDWF